MGKGVLGARGDTRTQRPAHPAVAKLCPLAELPRGDLRVCTHGLNSRLRAIPRANDFPTPLRFPPRPPTRARALADVPTSRLYVGNMSWNSTNETLTAAFAQYGPTDARLVDAVGGTARSLQAGVGRRGRAAAACTRRVVMAEGGARRRDGAAGLSPRAILLRGGDHITHAHGVMLTRRPLSRPTPPITPFSAASSLTARPAAARASAS